MQDQLEGGSEAAATGLRVCKELAHLPPGVGLETLKHHVSSIAALRQFIVEGAVVSAHGKEPALVHQITQVVRIHGIVPSVKGFAMQGLQQACCKPSQLQAERMQLITMICEILGHAITIDRGELYILAKGWAADKSSEHAEAADHRIRTSRPQSHEDLLKPIANACNALAVDLEFAVQQQQHQQQHQQQQQQPRQQQTPKGLRGGFLASSSQRGQPTPKQHQGSAHQQRQERTQQQQQQQQRSWDHPPDQSILSLCMSLGRGLLTVWNAAVSSLSDSASWSSAMFQVPASRAALLPVVQLLLAMLKARKTIVCCTYNSIQAEVDAINSVATAVALMHALVEAILHDMTPHIELPGLRQFVTSQQLQQLLFINLAWHVEMLDKLRQGKRSVVSADVLKRLGNKASRVCNQQQPASSGSGSGDDSVVPPHHLIVFRLLGLADHDPARLGKMLVEDKVMNRIPDACTMTAMALQYSFQEFLAAAAAATGPDTSRPASTGPDWPQKAVALVRMLLQLQQLLPQAEVVFASCCALVEVMQIDVRVWKLAIASEANQEVLLLLQPAVLQAVQQADQRQQEMIDETLRLSGVILCQMAVTVDLDHWKKAIAKSPQECCAYLDVAFRTMGAAAAAVASGSSPSNITGYMPPRELFFAARDALITIQLALKESQALVARFQPTEAACDKLMQQQHAPFLFSVMATLLKCGAALRHADPASALLVADCVAACRVRRDALTPEAYAALAELAAGMGMQSGDFVSQLMSLEGVLAGERGREMERILRSASNALSHGSSSSSSCDGGNNKSDATEVVGSRGRVGDFKTSSEIVQQGLYNFCLGCASSSSSEASSANVIFDVWFREAQVAVVTPWIVAAAGSVFLIGQVLCEVLGGQKQCKQQQPQMMASPRLCELVLLNVFACVEWLGFELCQINLPGDTADCDSKDVSSDSSSMGCDSDRGVGADHRSIGNAANSPGSAGSHAALRQLLEQQAQTQQTLLQAVQRCLDTNSSSSSSSSGGGEQQDTIVLQQFKQVWGLKTAQHLRDFAASVTAALPVGYCCNNPGCCNLGKLSELQLVAGSGKLCGQCRVARYCGPVCQKAHWKMHKAACKRLAAHAAAGQK